MIGVGCGVGVGVSFVGICVGGEGGLDLMEAAFLPVVVVTVDSEGWRVYLRD